MSSNRHSVACEAYLQREDESVGPLRLPAKNTIEFIKQFNRVYRRLGLRIQTVDDVPALEQK
ncbi:hypothetical protein [Planctomycetes bacterium K23_9]|uniref:Uncharacterized protein n=1 Tax=Stieleria marina TaxID=1930275 RepID=A0A517NXI9_9BACT|nr:hypothetical protein K239x_38490 [Planctomycetes bacterium K23_9]